MPSRACSHPTCANYTRHGRFCREHQPEAIAARAAQRSFYDQHVRDVDAKRFYNSAAWLDARRRVLARDPVCRRCLVEWSKHVHHVKPLRECDELEKLAESNLRGVCVPCHNAIEAEARAAS